MLKILALTGFSAILLACSLRVQAEDGASAPVELVNTAVIIDGDKLELQLDRSIRYIGKPSVLRSGQDIADNTIEFDVQNQDEAVLPTASANELSSGAIVIDGDRLELHLDRKMRAIGNASIHQGKQDIFGDEIAYDVQNDELHVNGNVRIELPGAKVSGPELHMRLSESIGEMRDASITMTQATQRKVSAEPTAIRTSSLPNQALSSQGGYSGAALSSQNIELQDGAATSAFSSIKAPIESRANAKTLFLEGPDKKLLKDARFTTCAADVDDWYIKASELQLNDYTESATAKNGYIEFKGVPILYSPWIGFSYNSQRKSGLLAPTYGTTTRSGFEISVPYYWNIAPNMDATITTRELTKRGIQLQGELRYLEEKYTGIASLQFLPSDNQTGENRYYANLKHQQSFSNGWSAGYSYEKTSDNQYFSDLSTRIINTSQVLLPQQVQVNYANKNWQFNAIAQKFQTLNGISYPYERLPQMTLNGNKYYGNTNANLYTQFVAFDTNQSNVLASTLATGTRATAYPSIKHEFNQPYGYITPKIGVHMTSYTFNNDPNNIGSQQRTVPIASIDSGLFFDRDFKVANSDYSQTLEPRLFYVYAPNRDQSKLPLYDTGLLDLNFSSLFTENQFTGNDRINNANQVSFALTSRFIESKTGTQRLSATIGQRHYFADQKVALNYTNPAAFRKGNSSDIIAGLSANLKTSWKVDAYWQYNTADGRSVRQSLSSRYNPEPGKSLNLSYSNRNDLAASALGTGIDQFNVSAQWPLSQGWYGVGRMNYSLREKQVIETLAGVEYNAGCWITRSVIQRVSTATAQANYALFFQLELGGLASIGSDPLSLIQRSVPGYVNSRLIPGSYQ
jgi:LPS-assembly protein